MCPAPEIIFEDIIGPAIGVWLLALTVSLYGPYSSLASHTHDAQIIDNVAADPPFDYTFPLQTNNDDLKLAVLESVLNTCRYLGALPEKYLSKLAAAGMYYISGLHILVIER